MEKRTLKIILLGDSNVGKTSIIKRYTKNEFSLSTMATVAGGVVVKNIEIGKIDTEVQIWDTAGQERFSCLSKLFFRSCHACLIVFDLTSPVSFDNVVEWKKQFVEFGAYEEGKMPPVFLVGNKLDLKKASKVSLRDMENVVEREKMYGEVFRVSASKDTDVNQLFQTVAQCAFHYAKTLDEAAGVKVKDGQEDDKNKKKSSCC